MIISEPLVDVIPLKTHTMISLVGGGGKTSLMQELAEKYSLQGKTVLMTTTTKVQSPDCYSWKADHIFTNEESILSFIPQSPCSVLYAEKTDIPRRLIAPKSETIEKLLNIYDIVLCEADGSRHLPIKIHTDRDPVILEKNDWTICMIGAWSFGQMANLYTFGLPSDKEDNVVDISFINWYLHDSEGLLKRTEKDNRCIVITGSEHIKKDYLEYFSSIEESVFLH